MHKSPFISLRSLLIIFLILLQIPSCVHEPVRPLDTAPIDSVINPIDTTQNPTDTTKIDTVIIPCDPDTVYFSRDILPVMISNCAKSGCHDETTRADGVILNTYANVFGTGDIKPGDPEDSDLYERLVDDDLEDRMPPSPAPPLDQTQIDLIYTWILQGAQDLSCGDTSFAGGCDTTDISYAQHLVPILAANCTGCHQGANPSGGINLKSYSGVAQAASTGQLYGALARLQGFSPMPQGTDPLSPCRVNQFKSWIDAGAADN